MDIQSTLILQKTPPRKTRRVPRRLANTHTNRQTHHGILSPNCTTSNAADLPPGPYTRLSPTPTPSPSPKTPPSNGLAPSRRTTREKGAEVWFPTEGTSPNVECELKEAKAKKVVPSRIREQYEYHKAGSIASNYDLETTVGSESWGTACKAAPEPHRCSPIFTPTTYPSPSPSSSPNPGPATKGEKGRVKAAIMAGRKITQGQGNGNVNDKVNDNNNNNDNDKGNGKSKSKSKGKSKGKSKSKRNIKDNSKGRSKSRSRSRSKKKEKEKEQEKSTGCEAQLRGKENRNQSVVERSRGKARVTNGEKVKYSSMIGLADVRSKRTEYFKLYKDEEIGLSNAFQQELKESSRDDDYDTDKELIESAQFDIEDTFEDMLDDYEKDQSSFMKQVSNLKYLGP